MNKLTGKIAVVTGASKGMGAGIAKALAAAGASVVLTTLPAKRGRTPSSMPSTKRAALRSP